MSPPGISGPQRPDPSGAGTARRGRGFQPAAGLLQERIRKAGEKRGFAIARLLTHWPEIAGPEIARACRPVRIGYGRGGMGASLTLLVFGAEAPRVQMQLESLRARVNAAYGYNAIARIHLTQTAPQGFAEAQAGFAGAPPQTLSHMVSRTRPADPAVTLAAQACAEGVVSDDLRAALETLAQHVLARNPRSPRTS